MLSLVRRRVPTGGVSPSERVHARHGGGARVCLAVGDSRELPVAARAASRSSWTATTAQRRPRTASRQPGEAALDGGRKDCTGRCITICEGALNSAAPPGMPCKCFGCSANLEKKTKKNFCGTLGCHICADVRAVANFSQCDVPADANHVCGLVCRMCGPSAVPVRPMCDCSGFSMRTKQHGRRMVGVATTTLMRHRHTSWAPAHRRTCSTPEIAPTMCRFQSLKELWLPRVQDTPQEHFPPRKSRCSVVRSYRRAPRPRWVF